MNLKLKPEILVHSFSDFSGCVFFNIINGQTFALAITATELQEFISSGLANPKWDSSLITRLAELTDAI
ncbi:hypothetical protein [Alishewanella sp. HL-SH06]|uniref:hypothetical protein n=1 Tax=Alishewanella sp. HL-SH06 TaxID=3461144 RepID=UPI004040F11A